MLAVGISLLHSAIDRGGRTRLPVPGVPAWWVADRDADAVYALDGERTLALRVPIRRPIAIRSTSDGGAWILCSTTATARGGRSLLRIRPDGSNVAEVPVGGHPELASMDDDALVVEDGARPEDPRRLVRCRADGRRQVLLEEPALACAIASGTSVIAGSSAGAMLRLDVENHDSRIERVPLAGPILGLAPAGTGSIYALHGEDRVHLVRLESDLSIAWSAPCAARSAHLAAKPDGEQAWVVDLDARILRQFDRAGRLALERSVPGTDGIDASVASAAGDLVLATPGALLVFDEQGSTRPGQGGFAFVVDVDRIPGR